MIQLLARKSFSGELYVRIAKMHLENHEWGRALTAIDEALEKGGLVDGQEAYRLRGEICSLLGHREICRSPSN